MSVLVKLFFILLVIIYTLIPINCGENNEFDLNIRYLIENSRNRIFNNFGRIKFTNEISNKKGKSNISNFEFILSEKDIFKYLSKECSRNSDSMILLEIKKEDNTNILSSIKAVSLVFYISVS